MTLVEVFYIPCGKCRDHRPERAAVVKKFSLQRAWAYGQPHLWKGSPSIILTRATQKISERERDSEVNYLVFPVTKSGQ